jgi:long-subunit acyl-CoA synthetase (AMP-forming)
VPAFSRPRPLVVLCLLINELHSNSQLEQAEKIRKFIVMNTEFPDEVRSLTAFQKVKVGRQVVEQRYQSEINKIYTTVSNGGDA